MSSNNERDSSCKACTLPFGKKDNSVRCAGLCGSDYHVDCTGWKGLSPNADKKKLTGLKWFCETCNKVFERMEADGFMSLMISQKIAKEISNAFEPLITKLDVLTKIKDPATVDNGSPFVQLGSNRKRKRVDKENDAQPKFSASYRDKLKFGTKNGDDENAKLKGVGSSNEMPDDWMSIYVSHLAPATEAINVIEYLMDNKLIANDQTIKCSKLVSPKANCEGFTYVSFKIDAPKDLFDVLVQPSAWPTSVAVREFVQKPRQSVPIVSLISNSKK